MRGMWFVQLAGLLPSQQNPNRRVHRAWNVMADDLIDASKRAVDQARAEGLTEILVAQAVSRGHVDIE